MTLPAVAREADRGRILDAVERYVRPADAGYLRALRAYLPLTREVPGLCSTPGGEERYRARIRAYTSLDVGPEELHRIGIDELESIEADRRVIARAAGHGDDTAAYRAALRRAMDSGAAVVVATHDVEEAVALASITLFVGMIAVWAQLIPQL